MLQLPSLEKPVEGDTGSNLQLMSEYVMHVKVLYSAMIFDELLCEHYITTDRAEVLPHYKP